MTTKIQNIIRIIGLMTLLAASTVALSGDGIPGQSPDRDLIKTQRKVDELFEKGDYERAMNIYRRELAPLGDKFAQYMVGYMHYSGSGVPADRARACAWYRLAAERGEESFVKVRDALHKILTDDQRGQSSEIYAELRAEMGDIVSITNLINGYLQILRERGGDEAVDGSDYDMSRYEAAADRIERVIYLSQIIAEDQSASDDERRKVQNLVAEARREIDVFRDSIN